MRIGILGGTFNPIHYGHLRIAEEVRERFNLTKVLFIPSGIPPFKFSKELIPAHHRAEMVRLAIKSNPFFEISYIEIEREGISYTVDTLEILKHQYSDSTLYFIAGADAVADLPKWNRPHRVLELAEFIVVTRPGAPLSGLKNLLIYGIPEEGLMRFINEEIEEFHHRPFYFEKVSAISISGTLIRSFMKAKKSIKYLLPEEVEYYIIKNRILDYNKPT